MTLENVLKFRLDRKCNKTHSVALHLKAACIEFRTPTYCVHHMTPGNNKHN